ncbi:MAG: DUF1134 domain-containing protein [Candidatus Moranbacteria bacterium]|nr:DUF1134 domain-containing protein [Candidatus Moranbacteria bacterium]NTW75687.1 DUF1134 domain-containing protein [Candidatus Moranbacteria bacterium]
MSENMAGGDIFGPPYEPPREPSREKKIFIDLYGQHEHYKKRFAPEPFQIETYENGCPKKYPDLPDDEFVVADVTTQYGDRMMFLCYNLYNLQEIYNSYGVERRGAGSAPKIIWQHLLPEKTEE